MSFNFKSQLKLGSLGETLFFEANCSNLYRLDGKHGDFQCKRTKAITELKTDYWNMEATPNMFFERYSDMDKQSPGGPWQSLLHGAKYFVYFYVQNLTYFRFECEGLVAALDTIIPDLKPTEVKNTSHITLGYRVPRDTVIHLAKEVKLKVTK